MTQSKQNRSAYISAIIFGVLIFVLMFSFVDIDQVLTHVSMANYNLLLLAFLPFTIEIGFTTLRIQHCVNRDVPFTLALYCNSIYMTWLSILPARLGEVAGIAVFKTKLKMVVGSAIASVIVQRIYDILILTGLLVAFLSQTLYGGKGGLMIAIFVLLVLTVALISLRFWLGTIASILLRWRRWRTVRGLVFMMLQARTWYRHQSSPKAVLWLTITTLGKWLVNLGAVYLVFVACGIDLSITMIATVGILMHFLGAIPVQSFGGFGASDLGLAGILASLGIPAEQAVATSIIFRLVVLSFVGTFFIACYTIVRPWLRPLT